MLPDGTLVVPIRDDADGSDDEEELSGIIEVEEEDYDDEEDGMKSTRTSKTTLTSPGPLPPQGQTDRVAYRYQLRPSSSGRRSVAGVGSDAGSVALSDKYKRVGRVSRPKSDDQVGGEKAGALAMYGRIQFSDPVVGRAQWPCRCPISTA